MWSNMLDYLGWVGGKIVDAIVWPFKKGFEIASDILSALPGGDSIGSLLPGSGSAPASAGVAASGAARAAASSTTNNSNRRGGDVQQNTTINVTQLPGESGDALARRIDKQLQQNLRRAVDATQSGVE
jgi:hypothetical protein